MGHLSRGGGLLCDVVLPQRPGSAPGETRRPLAASPGVAWLRLGPLRRMPHMSRQREGQTLGAPRARGREGSREGPAPGRRGDTCKAGPRRPLRQHGEARLPCGGHEPSAVRGRPGRRSEKRPWDVGLLLSEDTRAWGRVWGRELLPGMGARARGPCRRKGSSSGGGGEPWGAVGSLGNGCRGGRL